MTDIDRTGEGSRHVLSTAATSIELPQNPTAIAVENGRSRPESGESRLRDDQSVRRFAAAAVAGVGVVLIPYLWVLFALWEPPSLFRTTNGGFGANFYDVQARAILSGHLYLPNGSIGTEAFLHNGHEYTYFGLLPSLLRIPILLLTHSLDGRLTALSILIAWLLTGLFTSLLVWRVRILLRGPALLGRAEAASLGVLMATIMGGSVLVFLAANPYVYSEDLAWSVAATAGSFFALLGVLEHPSTGRVLASGVLVLAAYLTRGSTGLACVIGAVMVALWFALGRGGASNRRWCLPMFAVVVVALVIGSAINYAKFGLFFGFKTSEQLGSLYFPVAKYKDFSFHYLPTTIHAYLQPVGLRISDVFPYLTMPPEVYNPSFIVTDPTASVPASMPLLFVLSVWGAVCAIRPRPPGGLSAVRWLLVAAAVSAGAVLIFGWIIDRYLADFLPFLIMASAVGLVDVWRRSERSRRRTRGLVLAVTLILGLLSIAANFGIAISPTETWSPLQARNYVEFQESISHSIGPPLSSQVMRGHTRPTSWAPRGQLFVVGDCSALYVSDGLGAKGITNLGINWILLEQAPNRSLCRSVVADR